MIRRDIIQLMFNKLIEAIKPGYKYDTIRVREYVNFFKFRI